MEPAPAMDPGSLLMRLFGALTLNNGYSSIGQQTPQPGTSRQPIPQTVAPGKIDLPAVPAAPAPAPAVPGNQRIPIPTARPMGLIPQIFGPSISPSQEGVVSESPSQGPDAAVSPDAPVNPTSIMEAIQRITQPAGPRAPTAPAPPGPARMAPGAASKLIGGQNPLAQVAQTPPVMVLLSKLLGGR
jgi:hypothetical protein